MGEIFFGVLVFRDFVGIFLGNLGALEVLRGFLLNLGIFGFFGGIWGFWGVVEFFLGLYHCDQFFLKKALEKMLFYSNFFWGCIWGGV